MCSGRPKLVAAVVLLSLAGGGILFGQAHSAGKNRVVVVTRLTAPPSDNLAHTLASTITTAVDVVMQLTGGITVERADFLAPTLFLGRALEYYRRVKADGAVYGSVTLSSGGSYTIDLDIWNSAHPNAKPIVIHRTIGNLLSLFGLADTLSLKVASTIVGRTLSEGTLVVKNLKGLKNFAVYADGHLLGRDRSSLQVLTGKREIVVAKPGLVGDIPIKVFHVTITKGHTTVVSLPLPKPPPAKPAVTKKPAPSHRVTKPPVPPAAKPGVTKNRQPKTHRPAPAAKHGLLRLSVTPRAPAPGHFTITGPSGTMKFDLYTSQTKSLSLAPGAYRLSASLGVDPGTGYRRTIEVQPGKTTSLDVPLGYTTPFKISRLTAERNLYRSQLASGETKRRRKGRSSIGLTLGGLAGGVLAGVSYFLGKGSYSSYMSATTAATATKYRTEVLTYSGLTIGGGIVGAGLLLSGLVVLHGMPTRKELAGLKQSVSKLDREISVLAAKEGK